MILLTSVNDTLEVITSSTANITYYVSYVDITTTTFTPGASQGTISSATTTPILSAPGSSTQRQVKYVSIVNTHATASNNITVLKDISATEYRITGTYTLAAGERLQIDVDGMVKTFDKNGREKQVNIDVVGYTGFPKSYIKVGTAAEAIGVSYCMNKDNGFPGAYSLGAPGVNGWWVDASQTSNAANPAGASQIGAEQLQNPSTGSLYLIDSALTSSVAHFFMIFDWIWYNTGITVTTTTAQNITQPATSIPARDSYGTTNGEGWQFGILVTTATTNAGAITNTTASYTNSDGTAGKTATIASFPATAVVGTFVPFQLAAGDRGARSIQSITLGTSYGGGAISVIMYRDLVYIPNPVANVGSIMNKIGSDPTGIRIYNGTGLGIRYIPSATTATNMAGTITIIER